MSDKTHRARITATARSPGQSVTMPAPRVLGRRCRSAFKRFLKIACFSSAALSSSAVAATITSSTAFTPADPARATSTPYMDRGGVWNGSTEVTTTTGDTFSLTISNSGSNARDMEVRVTLPVGISYVSNSVQITGVTTTVDESVSGQVVTFTLGSGEFDLPNGGSFTLDFGLAADSTIISGTYQLTYEWEYGDNENDSTPTIESTLQAFIVQSGDSLLEKSPPNQTVGIGETASWTVELVNSSLGGLFDVQIDESNLIGNSSFSNVVINQTAPTGLTAFETAPGSGIYILPYLAAGETLSFSVTATVIDCSNLGNTVATNDRTGLTVEDRDSPVILDLGLPLVAFTAPTINLDYLAVTPVSVVISNVAGAGPAEGFILNSSLNELDVTVSNVGSAFTYNPANGQFTLVNGPDATNPDAIPEANSVTLTFDLQADDVCAIGNLGTTAWQAQYTNECSDLYTVPFALGAVNAPSVSPSVNLDAEHLGNDRLTNNEASAFRVSLTAAELSLIATDPLVVDVTVSSGVTILSTPVVSAGSTSDLGGGSYQWTVAKSALGGGAAIFDLPFEVDPDPCLGGTTASINASVSASSVTTASGNTCLLSDSDQDTFTITNNPGADTSQFFNVSAGSPFEAGSPSTDGTRDNGEGEFIPFVAEYEFDSGYPGQWIGSEYRDDFGGLTQQTIVPGSVTIAYGTGSSISSGPIAVPAGSLLQTTGGLIIDLGFLEGSGFLNTAFVSDTIIRIEYETTIPDAELVGNSSNVQHQAVLELSAGNGTGACVDMGQFLFTQVVDYQIQKAVATLNVDLPTTVNVCEVIDVVLTVTNANQQSISNILLTLDTSNPDYEYLTGQTPVYGGDFSSANIVYTENGGVDPTFLFTGGDLPSSGTVTVQVIRKASSTTAISGLSAQVDYDDNETNSAGARAFSASGSDLPDFVFSANLVVTVTPDSRLQVNSERAEWTVFVQNVDVGIAFGAEMINTLPNFLEVNQTETAAANSTSFVVTGSASSGGETITFDLGDMPSGSLQTLRVITDLVPGANCLIPDGQNAVVASWGCTNELTQTQSASAPDISFGSGALQVIHDTTSSVARLCSLGEVRIRAKNTGDGVLDNLVIEEILDPTVSGIQIVPGSVAYATDNAPGTFISVGNPSGTGTPGDPYVFDFGTGGLIPAVTELVSVVDDTSSTVNEVVVRFEIEVFDLNLFSSNDPGPNITASGTADLFCGENIDSPGIPFVLPSVKPDITANLTLENIDTGSGPGEIVVGASGETIQWILDITNNGISDARFVTIRIPISGSGGTATISGDGASGNYSGDWITINDIAGSGGTAQVVVTEVLGTNCVIVTSTAEVTWGCSLPTSGQPNVVSEPSQNTDTATLSMSPNFSTNGGSFSQAFARRNDGRGRIRITMVNSGALAENLVLTEQLSENVVYDNSVLPIFSNNNSSLTGIVVDDTDPTQPIFTLAGSVDTNERFTLEFYVRSNIEDTNRATAFPQLALEEETGSGLDPTISLGGSATLTANYSNSCSNGLDTQITPSVDPRQPDLDINFVANNERGANPVSDTTLTRIVFPGVEETFDVYVRNEGEGGSVATNNEVVVTLGSGWGSSSVELISAQNGTPQVVSGSGSVFTLSPAIIGNINRNQEIHLQIKATPLGSNLSDSLQVKIDVDGEQVGQDGNGTGIFYTRDSRAFAVLGIDVDKSLQSGSTTESITANEADLVIGEEVTFDLSARFFGDLDGTFGVSDLIIRDNLGNLDASDRGLGLVAIDTSTSEITASVTTTPTGLLTSDPVANGSIDFDVGTLSNLTDANNEFVASVTARVLNDAALAAENSDGKTLVNNLGVSFDFQGVTYHSDNANDGFSGGISRSDLHAEESITVQRPTLSIEKEVRNLTSNPTGAFADTTTGEAGDLFEFKITLTNTDSTTVAVPVYDLSFTDTLNARFNLLDGSSSPAFTPGADTNGDNTVDVTMSGGVTPGPGGSLLVNSSNLTLPGSGTSLLELDPGESVVILYQATATVSVNPSETLTDPVLATGDTLPGAEGSQSTRQGATGDEDGAAVVEAEDDPGVTVNIEAIDQNKSLITTSVGSDAATDVLIGEQLEFEVEIILPQGTAPSLQIADSLPEAFELVSYGNISLGNAVTVTNDPPVLSPLTGAIPASGDPLSVDWDFGDTIVSAGTTEERTISVRYTVQVRNIDGLANGDDITNSVQYIFTGSPVDIDDVVVTVREAELAVTKEVSPTSLVDAGDVLTYTITIDNATGLAAAYDLTLTDTLPAGLSYVANSTTILTDPGQTSGLTGTLGEPDDNSGILIWGAGQGTPVDLDLADGGKLVFTFQVTVDDTVEPDQELLNTLLAAWTSLDGDPGPNLGTALGTPGDTNGERIGGVTAPNTLEVEATATSTVAKTSLQTKTASGQTLPLDTPADGFRVGDVMTFTVTIDVMEGTHESFTILDTLPDGLEFVSFDPLSPVGDGSETFTYTALIAGTTAPSAGATGNLSFAVGTLINAGDALTDNDTLTLVYRARIVDNATFITPPDGNPGTTDTESTLENTATLSFLEADDEVFTTTESVATVTIQQPELGITKDRVLPSANNRVLESGSGRFRLTVSNSGDAPAYNAKVVDTLPVGMRQTAPVVESAELDGVSILSALSIAYSSATGQLEITLSDTQIIEPAQDLVIEYTFTVDTGAAGGQTLTNSADITEFFSKPSSDNIQRRLYNNVAPDTEDIVTVIGIGGTVFEDLDADSAFDSGESWANGVTVFVNLVQSGLVIASVQVDPGSGEYFFEGVAAGSYELVLTDSATNPLPVQPNQWLFFDPAPRDGRLSVTVGSNSLSGLDFALVQGVVLTGRVFQDDGNSGGTANDGLQNGGETGLSNIPVRLTNSTGTELDSVETAADGSFTLTVPVTVTDGETLFIEETDPFSFISISGSPGTTGGSYDRNLDRLSFVYQEGVAQSGILFGDVPTNQLLTDGQKTIAPGSVAFYAHTFIAGTGGNVSFSLTGTANPSVSGWSQTLFLDTNCNGQLDSGETQIQPDTFSATVVAGQQLCLIIKVGSPAGISLGAQYTSVIQANFDYTNSSPAFFDNSLTRQDLTVIGEQVTAGLELVKSVDKQSALPGETITYTIVYTNQVEGNLGNIVIFDSTPAFTNFVAASTGSFPNALTGVSITDPGVGGQGAVTWTFTGELASGESGSVTYQVEIESN